MKDFNEVNKSYTVSEAIREAQRCLNCKVPQCQKGCPVNNEIPDWISQLAKGNFGNAIQIIRHKSNLPAVYITVASFIELHFPLICDLDRKHEETEIKFACLLKAGLQVGKTVEDIILA